MANTERLISAWKLVSVLAKKFRSGMLHYDDLMATIADVPTVDAVGVVHGRWEKAEYNGWMRCDKCKDVYIEEGYLGNGKWNYCPNCGAKMDAEVEE